MLTKSKKRLIQAAVDILAVLITYLDYKEPDVLYYRILGHPLIEDLLPIFRFLVAIAYIYVIIRVLSISITAGIKAAKED